jgi:hypothetical protein
VRRLAGLLLRPAGLLRLAATGWPVRAAGRLAARTGRWLAWPAVWLAGGILLFSCYLPISRTQPADSDGASVALQAWAMLHGNLLLHGWWLSDVSFYTTELPEYMLIELVRGLRPDVVHVAGAMTFTLLVLLAALLARRRQPVTTRTSAAGTSSVRTSSVRAARAPGPGPAQAGRGGMLIAAGIMSAPQLGAGVYVLLLDPDHAGTAVPVLLAWLLLDRAPRRWYVPPAVGLLLAWALVADSMVAIIGVVPLLAVCVIRCYRNLTTGGQPLRRQWFELSLAAAALAATASAKAALALIAAHGGFRLWPVGSALASFGQLPGHVLLTAHGLLLLFGADFFSHSLGLVSGLAMLHWVGLALAAWASCIAIRHLRRDGDLVDQLLGAAVLIGLGAYLLGTRAVDMHSTREIAAVLPFGAVLAGRLLAPRLEAARLRPALLVVATGYLLCLGREMAAPALPADGQVLAAWLIAHHLDDGLAGYWQAASTTLASRGEVHVASIAPVHETVVRGMWESDAAWFDPQQHTATFVILPPGQPGVPYPWTFDVRTAFGQPARIYNVGPYTVLVWNRNLLSSLP